MQREVKARGELSRHVECYWSSNEKELILIPDGTFNVIFSAGCLRLSDGRFLAPGAHLIPIITKKLVIQTDRFVVGIRFKAFSKRKFATDWNAQKISDIGELEGRKLITEHFTSSLVKEPDLFYLLPEVEEMAYELISHDLDVNEDFREKVNYILNRKGNIKVSQLSAHFGISRQALHKQFIQNIGISAKDLAGIWRLNYFLTLIESDFNLTEGLLEAGFFDQSHGIRVFKEKMGDAPMNFLKNNPEIAEEVVARMIKRFNNYYDPDTRK